MKHERIVITVVAVSGLLLCAELATYGLFGKRAMASTVAPFLPPSSRCRAICLTAWSSLSPSHQTQLDRLLEARYQTVYHSEEELPDSVWTSDRDNVCRIEWLPVAGGLLWSRARYSQWPELDVKVGLDETYVWFLFRWVPVRAYPTLERWHSVA
jgi:hypothetical protein